MVPDGSLTADVYQFVVNMDAISTLCAVTASLLESYYEIEFNARELAQKRWGTHPILVSQLYTDQFHVMFCEHHSYEDKFFQYSRISVPTFDHLLSLVGDKNVKRGTNMKKSISPTERLVIT